MTLISTIYHQTKDSSINGLASAAKAGSLATSQKIALFAKLLGMFSPETLFSLVKAGSVIAVPTDTVYGLAADPFNQEAIEQIYALKGRDEQSPLLILGSSVDSLKPLVTSTIPSWVSSFWPGPLTAIFESTSKVPAWVRRGRSTVGIRIPQHPALLALLDKTGPLAVTSANRSGEPPSLSEEEVIAIFGEDFPLLAGGPCVVGKPSTIVTVEPFSVLREGSLSKEEIEKRQ